MFPAQSIEKRILEELAFVVHDILRVRIIEEGLDDNTDIGQFGPTKAK